MIGELNFISNVRYKNIPGGPLISVFTISVLLLVLFGCFSASYFYTIYSSRLTSHTLEWQMFILFIYAWLFNLHWKQNFKLLFLDMVLPPFSFDYNTGLILSS